MSPANSIEIAIWAAVGGRASLVGPILGAFIVNGAKSWLTVAYPEYWLYFLGALFIAVTLFLPNGIVGLVKKWASREGRAMPDEAPSPPAQRADAAEHGVAERAEPVLPVRAEGARA
jgi:urea transport system permease protein